MPPGTEYLESFQKDLKGRARMPLDTFFIDTSELAGPFMNSTKKTVELGKNLALRFVFVVHGPVWSASNQGIESGLRIGY